MNLLKLNTVVISTLALIAAGITPVLAASPVAAPLVKRGVLISVGNLDLSSGDVSSSLESNGYTGAELSGNSDAKSVAVGYRHPLGRWSADVSYIGQGQVSANVAAAPSASTDPAKDVALSLPIYGSGLNYAGLRHFPVSRGVSAHVGAGAFIYTSEREATIDGDRHVEKDGGVRPMAQLGLSFAITRGVSVELTGQRFFMPGEDVDRLSVGVSVGF